MDLDEYMKSMSLQEEQAHEEPVEEADTAVAVASPLGGPPPVSEQPGLGRPANVPEISRRAAGVGALSSSRRRRRRRD